MGMCGQNHIVRLDARQFLEQRARRVAQACAGLPQLQRLPQHEREEAHEDVRLHAIFTLMPDRANRQLILLDAEGRLGLRELDVRHSFSSLQSVTLERSR